MPHAADVERSRYRIEKTNSGYRIAGDGRNPVTIIRERFSIRVAYETVDGGGRWHAAIRLGLFEFRKLCRAVAGGLMAAWEPRSDRSPWPGARRWAIQQTAWAITARLHDLWVEMLRQADHQVLDVQRTLFAATFGIPSLALQPELYEDRRVVSDIHRYRAAAWAAAQVPELGAILLRRRSEAAPNRALEVLRDPFADDLLSPSEDAGRCVELLHDWRALYTADGCTYRSLDRTLMNLPGGVPGGLLRYLCALRLPRPLTHRLELILSLAWVEAQNTWAYAPSENHHVVLYARAPQIAQAMQCVARHLHVEWNPRRSRDIWEFARSLADLPGKHRGSIVGLAKKAVRWHRDLDGEAAQVAFESLRPETPTTRPSIPLPVQAGVTFLSTVGAVVAEGGAMSHCVACYADGAVAGDHFLFHVAHAGAEATVQVDRGGRVIQACGPRNARNKASAWGARLLARWAQALRRP